MNFQFSSIELVIYKAIQPSLKRLKLIENHSACVALRAINLGRDQPFLLYQQRKHPIPYYKFAPRNNFSVVESSTTINHNHSPKEGKTFHSVTSAETRIKFQRKFSSATPSSSSSGFPFSHFHDDGIKVQHDEKHTQTGKHSFVVTFFSGCFHLRHHLK